jgi:hypothetical protein
MKLPGFWCLTTRCVCTRTQPLLPQTLVIGCTDTETLPGRTTSGMATLGRAAIALKKTAAVAKATRRSTRIARSIKNRDFLFPNQILQAGV